MELALLERVRGMAEDIAAFAGMEVVHLEARREAGGWLVRLYIDKQGGVTIDDCATVSRQLSAQLDIEDPIPCRYTLEVSSPGLDRPLFKESDYKRFAGHRVRLSTVAPIDGRRNYSGRLEGLEDGVVRLTLEDGRTASIPHQLVARARLEIETGPPDLRGARGRHR